MRTSNSRWPQTHLPVGPGRLAGEVGPVGNRTNGPRVCAVPRPQLLFALWTREPGSPELSICLKKPTSGCFQEIFCFVNNSFHFLKDLM